MAGAFLMPSNSKGTIMATGYYLQDHANRTPQYGWLRARLGQPGQKLSGVIGVHTSEAITDFDGADANAENNANFLRTRSDYGSYSTSADADSILPLVHPAWATWADTTNNAHALSVAGCLQAARWMEMSPARRDAVTRNMALAAARLALTAVRDGYLAAVPPARRITAAEAISGSKAGFYGHGETNPGTRYDPGSHFNWVYFLNMYATYVGAPAQVIAPAPVAAAPAKAPAFVPDPHWRVDPGDTLGAAAKHFGVTVAALAKYNGIKDPNKIKVGERIWPPTGADTYVVDPGETLSGIVTWYHKQGHKALTLHKLQYANGINNPATETKVGLRLQIPK